jgi:hypothetical protein
VRALQTAHENALTCTATTTPPAYFGMEARHRAPVSTSAFRRCHRRGWGPVLPSLAKLFGARPFHGSLLCDNISTSARQKGVVGSSAAHLYEQREALWPAA